jgi:3-hydroxyisobutyrate dehydrogenase
MKRIGYIGLGIMGSAMAENLIKNGFEVTVWNRTPGKAARLRELGAKWADSPAEVARHVEAVCVNVTDTKDVEEVIFGKKGIVEGNPGDTAGLVVIDHSTISPGATRDFARRLEPYGIEFLDAPVSGGDVGARAGTLTVMCGGKQEVYDRCVPVLRGMGKTINRIGDVGAGQAAKACNQVLCAVNLVGACEAIALAIREGIDPRKMVEAVGAGAGGSWQFNTLGPKILNGDLKPAFMIDLLNKDLAIVADEARAAQLPMPATHLVSELFRAAARQGLGREGTQAVSRIVEQLGGFNYKPG